MAFRAVIAAPLAASLTGRSRFWTVGVTGAADAAVALGRIVTIAGPEITSVVAWYVPATIDWVATIVSPSAATDTASVTMPPPSRTASRAATSLPSDPEVIRIADGDVAAATAATASTLGTERRSSAPGEDTAYTVVAPYSPRLATAASSGVPRTTAAGSPRPRATVSSSSVADRTPAGVRSARTRTVVT